MVVLVYCLFSFDCFESCSVNNEVEFYIVCNYLVICCVDFVNFDFFYLCFEVMFGVEIEYILGLGDVIDIWIGKYFGIVDERINL